MTLQGETIAKNIDSSVYNFAMCNFLKSAYLSFSVFLVTIETRPFLTEVESQLLEQIDLRKYHC